MNNKLTAGLGALVASGGIAAIVAATGGTALAAGTPGSVAGNPVVASITVESATSLTLSGQPLTFPDDTGNGGTHAAAEAYTVATNDSLGYFAEVAGDDSDLSPGTSGTNDGNMAWPQSTCGTGGGAAYPAGWSDTPAFMGTASPQGFLDESTATCSATSGAPGGGGLWTAHSFIPWSALTLTSQTGPEAGTAQQFVSASTGGPQGQGGTGWLVGDSKSTASAPGGDSYSDSYSLTVPAGQAQGTYAADLWYGVFSN